MKRIHFIGICGVAMSALAAAFHKNGYKVTGSDAGFYPPISDYLKYNNISFYPGWHPEKMTRNGVPDIVVVGNAIGSTNPEFLYARKYKLTYKSYPEIISKYIVRKNSIVCAGTYGKTSTAALLAFIMETARVNPTYMFGGLSHNLPNSAKIIDEETDLSVATLAKPGWSVLEGDEYKTARWDSRPKFKLYSPTHLLLTSVSWDHADIYPTEETYLRAFKDLVSMIPAHGLIAACADDLKIKSILTANIGSAGVITYGRGNDARCSYEQVKQTAAGISFIIKHGGERYDINAPVLGEHMAENICGAFAMAQAVGIPEKIILNAIAQFKGIKRRLEKRYDGKITIYDDLAHSPAKALATLKTLRAIYPQSELTAIFEPNAGNRKSQSMFGYDKAFAHADKVIVPTLSKIKADPKDADPPFDGQRLKEVISKTHNNVLFFANDEELVEYVKNNAKKEDVVVFLGSHGWRGMVEKLIYKVKSA
jgi:UDP-N-acetylmuramate: L-alanyl-gamma-D-glutamyl-meso-diaminopimelate ligase